MKLGPRADEILDEFEARTGLRAEDDKQRRVFGVNSPEEHEIKVVETLTQVDTNWSDHLGFDSPLDQTDEL
jgi:hypothetical protein